MDEKNDVSTENAATALRPDYKRDVLEIVAGNLTPKLMRRKILDYHENDIAAALELTTKDERLRLYGALDAETLANIFEYSGKLDEYAGELDVKKRVEVLSELETATVVEYLGKLSKSERDALVELMNDEVKNEIALLSSFDENEIGAKMTTNYVAVRSDSSVRGAMKELIAQAADNDNISTVYVVDEDGTLDGAIDLKDLIIARENTKLEDITTTSYPYVYANEQIEDCIERIKDYSEDSIPVLDSENRLKGVLTAPDVAELIDDEMSEDYAMLAGLTAKEDLREPLKKSVAKRLPWLVSLLVLGLFVSAAVGAFEEVVASLALAVFFQSLVLDMAGNVGTQSLAVTIRVLMDEEAGFKQKLYLVAKESRVGFVNGLILGAASFAIIGVYLLVFKNQPPPSAFKMSFCVGLALLASTILSSVSGTVIPIVFKKLKIDPAVASGPFITTINDLVAVAVYYGLVWTLMLNVK